MIATRLKRTKEGLSECGGSSGSSGNGGNGRNGRAGLCNGKLYERSSSCGKYYSAKTIHEEIGKRKMMCRVGR